MSNFSANYGKILETLEQISNKMTFLNQKRKPKLSDIELIAVDLTSAFMGIDSERYLFRNFPSNLLLLIERSVYNRRKRHLFSQREIWRKKLVSQIPSRGCYIVDSMPLDVCKFSRSTRSTTCKEDYLTSPNKGYCASQNSNYYGYKPQAYIFRKSRKQI